MTEKEKNILNQELRALVSLSFDAVKHDFAIMRKVLKCVLKEDPDEMTPNKRKVIEELRLEWRFMKTLREDGWAKVFAGVTSVKEILRVTEEQ